ncbi:MAG TPA: glycosyltransferase [Nitrososphaeraceae archaeon]|nr:glycosyltransferase [Nitrososphaeraceae archaeon]
MKNKPKVLLYGTNYASVINSLAIGFKRINIPVKSISFDYKRSSYNNYSEIKCICTDNHPGRVKLHLYKIKGLLILIRYLLWCDVVHIYGSSSKPFYWLIAKLAKFKFVTFVGSDIRVPEVELNSNPFFKYAYYNKGYEYKKESNNDANSIVQYLTSLNYRFIVWDTEIFIDRKITTKVGIVPHASVNNPQNGFIIKTETDKKVLIIHSPTAPIAKGTEFVMKAIKKIKEKNLPFEFKLLKNLPNEEYQQLLMEADIYIDQLIWGGYGVAAQQALQMGIVVVAYITPERLNIYGDNSPVQNANIHNLAEVLERLIRDSELRKQISKKSVLYFQNVHQPDNVAKKMLATYKFLNQN